MSREVYNPSYHFHCPKAMCLNMAGSGGEIRGERVGMILHPPPGWDIGQHPETFLVVTTHGWGATGF